MNQKIVIPGKHGQKVKITEEIFAELDRLGRSLHDSLGREVPDPRPAVVPTDLGRPESLKDQIRRILRQEVSDQVASQGMETFEESQDFDVESDFDLPEPESIHTLTEEWPVMPADDPPPEKKEEQPPQPANPDSGSPTPDDAETEKQ